MSPSREDDQTLDEIAHRITRMEEALRGPVDSRSRNGLYSQAMIEGADYETLAEEAQSNMSPLTGMYAAMATMKYAKAAALKAR